MHSGYASETGWTGGPPNVLHTSSSAVELLDPKPFLVPQSAGLATVDAVDVTFALPAAMGVRLGIVNAQGIEVCQLAQHDALGAGRYTVSWDGRDSGGSRVPAGDYVVRLGFGSTSSGAQERSLDDRVILTR